MVRGSCLCGGVRYEITGALRGALNCHCSMCRKAHGAAFRSRASVKVSAIRLYESVGFSAFGREPGAMLVDGKLHDELHMCLRLTDSAP